MTEECNPFFRSESETTTYDNDPVALTVHSGMVERAVLMITAPQHSTACSQQQIDQRLLLLVA